MFLDESVDILDNAIDMHVHVDPDLVPRAYDEIDCIFAIQTCKMAGIVIKNHFWPTQSDALILNKFFNKSILFGSLTLNQYVGGLNPYAVEAALNAGAKVIWLPTRHSENHLQKGLPKNLTFSSSIELKEGKPVKISSENGELLPELYEIMDLIAKHDACLMTGHISPAEAIKVCNEALSRKIQRLVLTHPDLGLTAMNINDQIILAKKGVFIEKTMFALQSGFYTVQEIMDSIRKIGIDQCFFDTDFGMFGKSSPWQGMFEAAKLLYENDFTLEDIKKMINLVPHFLLNIT